MYTLVIQYQKKPKVILHVQGKSCNLHSEETLVKNDFINLNTCICSLQLVSTQLNYSLIICLV